MAWRIMGHRIGQAIRLAAKIFLIFLCIVWPGPSYPEDIFQQSFRVSPLLKTRAPISSVVVHKTYPHNTEAYTQGLLYYDGYLYESTGLNGKSSLARKEIETGKSLQEMKISGQYFGEGIALLNKKIYQLTWQNETLLVYDARSFREVKRIKYRGEGWGLTTNGKLLLMSDGSSIITFHDPETFKILREIVVRDGDIRIERLNELEYIKGEIWANVYQDDVVARISPANGRVIGWVDLSSLRSYLPKNAQVDVINGIAYDAKNDRIFVTGKFWPKVFEIRLRD